MKGQRFASLADLKRAVLAHVGVTDTVMVRVQERLADGSVRVADHETQRDPLSTTVPRAERQGDDERDARDIVDRLRAVLVEADDFARTRTGRGLAADWLRMYVPLRLRPLLDLPGLKGTEEDGGYPPLPPMVDGELSTIVAWYGEHTPHPTDRELAAIALRAGYWPANGTKPWSKVTVREVVTTVTKAVHKLRAART